MSAKPNKQSPHKKNFVRRFFSLLGPGLIAGAADDDPSGIATYSIAGAQLGTAQLWTAFITWPFMGCVQFMCAHIGMVTGKGLASALGQKFPRWVLVLACVGLLVANSINVGADLSGMADAAGMLTRLHPLVFVVFFGVGIGVATIYCRYYQIAKILKWLALCLFAYVITAFIAGPDWKAVFHDTFIPSWPKGHDGWRNLTAILGTTISPYLFFWQASNEVEHEKNMGRKLVRQREGATRHELTNRRLDVGIGTFFSNFTMYFIILTCSITLHKHGINSIETSKQAAEALRPLAGELAYVLYTLGLVGTGLLSIPTLTGSAAYAFAETFRWHQGLDAKLNNARYFYAVIIVSTVLGIALEFLGINPVKALFWTAIINGLLAPPLLIGILLCASDRKLMKDQPSSMLSRVTVGAITMAMFVTAIAMFIL